jgi:Ran GTPase-activating protein (RanGAP) involved in mRNA processing and transport
MGGKRDLWVRFRYIVRLEIDSDSAFDEYIPRSAYSLRDVNELEFIQTHWTDERLQHMSDLQNRVPVLTELVLDGKNRKRKRRDFNMEEFLLSSGGLEVILGGLFGHPALRILRVTSHGLSEKDVKHLAPSIQRLKQLHLLDLSGNRFGIGGVLAVAQCLSEMPDLVELNVRDNNISRSDVCNDIEYRHQDAWMALRMYSGRKGRVLIADLIVHAVLQKRTHLLQPRFHIGWQLVMKEVQELEKDERTILALGMTCPFLHEAVRQFYLQMTDRLSLSGNEDFDTCQQFLPEVIPFTHLSFRRIILGKKRGEILSSMLRRCSGLKGVTLSFRRVGAKEARVWGSCLEMLVRLQELTISLSDLKAESASELARALLRLTQLQRLELLGEEFYNFHMILLTPAFQAMTQLKVLNFCGNYNPRSDQEAKRALALALEGMTHLEVLNLSNNNIDGEGAIALATTLPTMTHLKVLHLGGNYISDEGARALARALPMMMQIEELFLSNTFIYDEGARALAPVLLTMVHLKVLDLRLGCQELSRERRNALAPVKEAVERRGGRYYD